MHDFLDNLGAHQYEKMINKKTAEKQQESLATSIQDLYSGIEELDNQLKDGRDRTVST